MSEPREPIAEVIARMKERLGTACFGSGDARDAERLIEEYAKLEAERDLLRQNHPFGAMYDALQKLQAENAQLRAALALADTRAINLKAGLGKMADALAWLQRPVTDEEWLDLCAGDRIHWADLQRWDLDALLAARAAGKGE